MLAYLAATVAAWVLVRALCKYLATRLCFSRVDEDPQQKVLKDTKSRLE